MNKMVRALEKKQKDSVINFMDGISYRLNPLLTLKMVTASSIFGEPQYYRNGEFDHAKIIDGNYKVSKLLASDVIMEGLEGLKTSEIMEKIIDEALEYDFQKTLEWAEVLRTQFFMRLNPQVIMVRASVHKNRKEFTEKFPSSFRYFNQKVMARAEEPAVQLTYWLYRNKSKNKIPSLLKRSWADRLSKVSRYELYKYKNKGLGLIDTIRICHANSKEIDELMRSGTIEIDENQSTWETMRSEGKQWAEILSTIKMGHMALLRNLRGIFTECEDQNICELVLTQLKAGVLTGKQFPFRYYSAIGAIKASSCHFKALLCDALEECIDLSVQNMPKLKGRTMCLSDNSGSAWGTFQSEYGSVTIAEIDNLSSVITAFNSEEGYVGKFGDKLKIYPVMKRNGILSQTQQISKSSHRDVGASTENGIWLFFDQAIQKKEHWDNIFIYSDQQAGHGGLYGLNPDNYKKYSVGAYIDVYKMIKEYRKVVNPKVNVFSIQTAGYNNILIPEICYRTSVLYGWTGKESIYADRMNQIWDEAEQECEKKPDLLS